MECTTTLWRRWRAIAQGINLVNQTTSSPLIPASNSLLPPFSNLLIPHTSNQSLFPTTALPASSTQCLCGLVPFPKFPWFFFPYDGWKTIICKLLQKSLYEMFLIRKKQKIENKTCTMWFNIFGSGIDQFVLITAIHCTNHLVHLSYLHTVLCCIKFYSVQKEYKTVLLLSDILFWDRHVFKLVF